jgi:hypothetical protein
VPRVGWETVKHRGMLCRRVSVVNVRSWMFWKRVYRRINSNNLTKRIANSASFQSGRGQKGRYDRT